MSPTSWFNEYIAKKAPGAEWDSREDFTLRLCMKYADEAACAQYVLASADAFIQADKCTPANAGALFFALDKTGEEKYREAVRQVMAKLNAQDAVSGLVEAYETLPFRMAYEMKLNRMERVGQTAAMFRSVHQRLWKAKAGRHDATLREEGWFLLGLTDAISVCSDQLYEHWRAMVDIYRETLRGVLRELEAADPQTLALLLYALLAGVEMGLIDPERYLPVARKGIASLRESGENQAADILEEGVAAL